MKAKFFHLSIIILIILISLPAKLLSRQTNETFEAVLTSIMIDNKNLPSNQWDALKVRHGVQIDFSFTTIGQAEQQIYYRIYLDGNILETKLLNSNYTLRDLTSGVHILRVIPVTLRGEIGRALVYSFTVSGITEKDTAAQEETEGKETWLNSIITYTLIGIVLIQLIIILVLLSRRKTNKDDNKVKNQALQELTDLRHSHKRIIEEIKNQKEENDYLRKQIKELNQNISMLEDANVHLLKQKEKLAESKRKLELLQNQKEELFAIAIHDIKNPASAIRSYIQLLNSYDLNAAEQQEIMASLVNSSDNIVKLTTDMCEIIAKSMPEPKLSFNNASMIKIIDNVCNQNISYAKTKSVKLINKSSRDIPDLKMDPDKIEEALDNLVNNAIKYAPVGTVVEVYSYLKQNGGNSVIVEVQDNGVGLSDEDMKKCFQKGAILSSIPTGLERSSGLGLWIVKRIIEDHNGKVWVNGKLGAGSTFGFELPV